MTIRSALGVLPAAACAALLTLQAASPAQQADPFAFFRPTVIVTAADRSRLDRGEPITRTLPSSPDEVAVFAAVGTTADGDRLVEWIRQIEALKRSSYVLSIGRFSDPPRRADLDALELDDTDLVEIRACEPGRCGIKLTAAELSSLQKTAADARDDWKAALQPAFRAVVLQRVQAYLASGLQALRPFVDEPDSLWPAARFSRLLGHSPFLTERVPRFAELLARYPDAPMPEVETFMYWSKERLSGRTIISATHVSILRPERAGLPDALVAGKQIFATHYLDGSLGLTSIVRGDNGSNYLVYLNRSDVDVLGGAFGGIVRWIVERRLKGEAAEVLEGLRHRLESGSPPAAGDAASGRESQ